MPTVQFERTFQAAHRLSKYEGKCSRIHGHNFHLTIVISTAELGDDGFVIEFDRVKELVDLFDHRLILNETDLLFISVTGYVVGGGPEVYDWIVRVPGDPTTEFMAQWFAEALADLVEGQFEPGALDPIHVKVKLRETDSISAWGHATRHR